MNERERVAAALSHVPADCDYETWWRLAASVYSLLGDEGHDLWDSWSRQSEDYKPHEARSTWRSVQHMTQIGGGTLFRLAQQHGWRGERRVVPRSPSALGRQSARPSALAAAPDDSAARKNAARMVKQAELGEHPYLARKGFPERAGLVLGEELIVPMRKRGELVSVQRIMPDGSKRFLRGSRVGGASHYVRRTSSPVLRVYVEGLASALSVDAALQVLRLRADVIVAFSAGNMPAVVRGGERGCRQFAVADNDASGAGEKAARATDLSWWMPEVEGWDANDVHQRQGLDVLANGLRAALRGPWDQ